MLRSVRVRLTLWYTAILAFVLITFSAISYGLLAREIRAATDSSIVNTAREFAAAFTNDRGNSFSRDAVALDFRFSDRAIIVISSTGQIIASSRSPLAPAIQKRIASSAQTGLSGFFTIDGGPEGEGVRVFAMPMRIMGKRFVAMVAGDLHEQAGHLESASRAIFLGIPLALVIAAAGGYVMARKSLQPVMAMSAQARHIGAETLDERIAVGNEQDELGFLASTLNDLLERLQGAFQSQRSFMADASHELRTPVSIIRGEADVVLSRPHREEGEYRESITTMQKASVRLTRIVDNLFLIARTDAGPYPVTTTTFYVDELVDDTVRAMKSITTAKRVKIISTCPRDLVLAGDEELMRRMLLNLVDNAVKFTQPGGRAWITVASVLESVTIRVADNGIGVSEEDRAHIFERFYRGSSTRHASRGAGLGLPIVRWIVESHGGRVEVEHLHPNGTAFIVTLPQGAIAD